jgi:hypothetical protein
MKFKSVFKNISEFTRLHGIQTLAERQPVRYEASCFRCSAGRQPVAATHLQPVACRLTPLVLRTFQK